MTPLSFKDYIEPIESNQEFQVYQYQGEDHLSFTTKTPLYISNRFLPSFEKTTTRFDFGFGEKKIDYLIKMDAPRQSCNIGGFEIPYNVRASDNCVKDTLRKIYRFTVWNDNLLFKITQVFNQRVGIDLWRLVCSNIDKDICVPDLISHDANLSLFRMNEDIVVSGKISGHIIIPDKDSKKIAYFKCKGIYNLSKDLAIHILIFNKI